MDAFIKRSGVVRCGMQPRRVNIIAVGVGRDGFCGMRISPARTCFVPALVLSCWNFIFDFMWIFDKLKRQRFGIFDLVTEHWSFGQRPRVF